MKHITTVEEYNQAISSGIVVVDYFAEWCGPCKIIAPVFEEYSKKYSNATFLKVDVDQVPAAAEAAGVRAMPTFQIFVNGQKATEIVGADKARLEKAISSACA